MLPVSSSGSRVRPAGSVGGETLYARLPGVVWRFDPATGDDRIVHTFVTREGRYLDGRDPTGKLFQAGRRLLPRHDEPGGPWNAGIAYKVDAAGDFGRRPRVRHPRGLRPEGPRGDDHREIQRRAVSAALTIRR